MKDELETYLEYFDEVELVKECDGYFYNVHDMLKVFVIGLLCGLKNMHEIHEWANEETIFAFLENRFGITKLPSYYWFTCLLKTINIDSLNKCFMNLAHELIEQARTVNSGTSYCASLTGRVLKNFVTSLFFKTSLIVAPFLTMLRNGGIEQFSEIDISSIVQF